MVYKPVYFLRGHRDSGPGRRGRRERSAMLQCIGVPSGSAGTRATLRVVLLVTTRIATGRRLGRPTQSALRRGARGLRVGITIVGITSLCHQPSLIDCQVEPLFSGCRSGTQTLAHIRTRSW